MRIASATSAGLRGDRTLFPARASAELVGELSGEPCSRLQLEMTRAASPRNATRARRMGPEDLCFLGMGNASSSVGSNRQEGPPPPAAALHRMEKARGEAGILTQRGRRSEEHTSEL